jgi:hypothetical protein
VDIDLELARENRIAEEVLHNSAAADIGLRVVGHMLAAGEGHYIAVAGQEELRKVAVRRVALMIDPGAGLRKVVVRKVALMIDPGAGLRKVVVVRKVALESNPGAGLHKEDSLVDRPS